MYYLGVATVGLINDTVVREGNTTTITCEAFGYPPPTVVWNRINGILSDRVSVSDSVSVPTGYGNVTRVAVNLTVTNASREDIGVYTCSANNSIGGDSSNVSITIQCKFITIFHFIHELNGFIVMAHQYLCITYIICVEIFVAHVFV